LTLKTENVIDHACQENDFLSALNYLEILPKHYH